MPQATSSVRAGGSAASARRAPRPPRPSRAARARRSGRCRGTSRRTPARACRSTPSPLLDYARGAAARVGAELLGGARPGDDRRARRGARLGGARLLDVHADEDHNRSVFTLVGSERRARRRRCSRASRARASGSTCGGTKARIRGSAPPTSSRSCRSPRRTWSGRARRRCGWPSGWATSSACRSSSTASSAAAAGRRSSGAGGPEELQRRVDAGELAPDFGPARLDGRGRRRARRRAAAADRVQRQPARHARGGARDRRASCASGTAASRACGRSGSSCRGPGSSR